MEVRIVDRRPNPLLERTELRFQIGHAGAPSPPRDEVRGELAKQLKVPKDRLVVESMHARFGIAETTGEAIVYDSTQGRDRVTREHILVRNGLREKEVAKTPEAPREAPAAKAPPAAEPAKPAPAPAEHAPKPKAEEPAAATPAKPAPEPKKAKPKKAE
jgi:small subunit ribosomal protein S24e